MALVNKPDESIFASSAKQGEVDNFPDLLRGWGITFDQTQGIPPMEWFNFLFKRLDEKHAYLMQRGLPEWSATQDYTKGSCVQFDGLSYRSLKAGKNNKPNESDSQYWVRWGFALTEIAHATLTQYGLTQLYTGYDSQREDLALTSKTAFLLKQLIDSNTRTLGNVIPNSKKSDAVNSNSSDTVATSKAVKTAHDKAIEAKTAADNAQRTADGKQSPATTLAGYGIGDFKIEPFVGNLNTLKTDGIYAITQASRSQNLPVSTSCHIQVIAGGDGAWCRQLAYVAYSTDIYERHQTSYQTDSWSAWVKVDSLDRVHKAELVGEVAFFARSTPPSGWLKANGAAVSRTTYAALFDAIGTTFGAGDGSTTFNLPDLRGEFIRGLDDGRNIDGGRRLGTAQGDAIKTHTITVPNSGFEGRVQGSWFYAESGNGNNNQKENTITYNGENETRPRNIALLACIKY